MEKPLLIYDRITLKNDRYLFVSYSHQNKDTVYEILDKLYSKGVNYWYDKGLNTGDIWDEKVRRYLESPKCVGAFIFLSKYSVISDAVNKEIEIILNRKNENDSFYVFPIVLGSTSVKRLFADAYSAADENNSDVSESTIPRIEKLLEHNKRLFHLHIETQKTVETLYDLAVNSSVTEQNRVSVTDDEISMLGPYWIEGGEYYIEAGEYSFSINGDVQPITWKLIKKESGKLFFASVYAIDFVSEDRIHNVIKMVLNSIHINKESYNVDLLSKSDLILCKDSLGRFIPTDYADSNRAQLLRLFWLSDGEDGKRLCNTDGVLINNIFSFDKINCGVRLVLTYDN